MNNGTKALVTVVFIVIIALLAYVVWQTVISKASTLSIQLTDPSLFPKNTQSINITYSSVQVHIKNATGSEWIDTYAGGSADLLSLVNSSETIAVVRIPLNSTVDMIRFNLTSGSIAINGTSSPLVFPNQQFTSSVFGSPELNLSSSLVLDFSPAIIPIFTANSTMFAMVPSLRGIAIQNVGSVAQLNQTFPLNASVRLALAGEKPNIEIGSASLGSNGNQTQVSITVSDNSNLPLTLRHLIIFGNVSAVVNARKIIPDVPPSSGNVTAGSLLNETFYVIGKAIGQLSSGSATTNASNSIVSNVNISQIIGLGKTAGLSENQISTLVSGNFLSGSLSGLGSIGSGLNASDQSSLLTGVIGNLTNSSYASSLKGENLTQLESVLSEKLASGNLSNANLTGILNLVENAKAEALQVQAKNVSLEEKDLGLFPFLLESNGTLTVPTSVSGLEGTAYGYYLTPGESRTFTYSGGLTLDGERVVVDFPKGNNYKLEVTGDSGALASINVTAG